MSCRDFQLKSLSSCRCSTCGGRAVDHAPPYGCNGRNIDIDEEKGFCRCCGEEEVKHPAFIVLLKTPRNERLLLL